MKRFEIDITFVILIAICLGLVSGLGGSYVFIFQKERAELFKKVEEDRVQVAEVPIIPRAGDVYNSATSTPTPAPNLDSEPIENPSQGFNLAVGFFPQAPEKKWDAAHEDYCEEASLLGVHSYIQGKNYTVAEQEAELARMREWEIENIGYFESTSIEQTARIAREYLGYTKVRIIDNPTLEQIRSEVLAGHPVIIPAYGKELKNPYFKNGGPMFHMYVVRGFTKDGGVIVNDPGTQHGENFIYTASIVMGSMHDWDHGQDHEKIPTGTPRVLVVE